MSATRAPRHARLSHRSTPSFYSEMALAASNSWCNARTFCSPTCQRDFFIDSLLVRIHFIIVMMRWTGLAPWEFEFRACSVEVRGVRSGVPQSRCALRWCPARTAPICSALRGNCAGSTIQGAGFRVQGPGFRVQGSGFRVQGSGSRVQGAAQWSLRVSLPRLSEGYVTKCAPRKALTLIT